MDFFKDVLVESGPLHYAEPYDADSFLKMPMNAIVNIGYVIVGIHWLQRIQKMNAPLWASKLSTLFAYFAIIYGPLQFMRITTQTRFWGILDQWITPPFFSIVSIWNIGIYLSPLKFQKDVKQFWIIAMCIMSFAALSYLLAVFHPLGFEVALGIQIVGAVSTSFIPLSKMSFDRRLLKPFLFAILSCSAFVILKVLDHHLAKYFFFQKFTGHFWSKIADVLQVHFVLVFLEKYYELLESEKQR